MKTFAGMLDCLFAVLPADVWADKEAMIRDSEIIVREARRRRGRFAARWLQVRIVANLLLTAVGPKLSALPKSIHALGPIFRETKYAFRRLRRGRALTLITIAVCALSIGATLAIGALTSTVLLGLENGGIPNADRVVSLQRVSASAPPLTDVDYPTFNAILQAHVSALDGVAAAAYATATCSCAPIDRPVHVGLVSDRFFDLLGVAPYLGRVPTDGEGDTALLSNSTWQTAFASSPAAIGAPILMNAHRFTVVGVAPPGFNGPSLGVQPAAWVNLTAQPLLLRPPQYLRKKFPDLFHIPGYAWLSMWASLAPSAAPEFATDQLRTAFPGFPSREANLQAVPLRQARVPPELLDVTRQFLGALSAAALLLLALAATALMQNSALRAEQTIPEVAARFSVGAPAHLPLILPFIDTAVVVLTSAVVGAALAPALLRVLFLAFPPMAVPVSVSISALTWSTGLIALGALVVLAAIPPICATVRSYRQRDQIIDVLRGQHQSSPRGVQRIGSIAVLIQVATATTFVGATLVITHLAVSLGTGSLGFNPDRLLVADVDLDQFDLTDAQGIEMTQRVREALRAVPGVRALTLASEAPFSVLSRHTVLDLDPRPRPGSSIDTNVVDTNFFDVLGVPVLRGDPTLALTAATSSAAGVVNRRFLSVMSDLGADPSKLPSSVVADVHYGSMFGAVAPLRYRFDPAEFEPNPEILMRMSDTSPEAIARLRRALATVRPELQRTLIRSMDENLAVASWLPRTLSHVLAAFAMTILLASVAGTFAVVAFAGECRRREYAIRSALGASSWRTAGAAVRTIGFWIAVGCLTGALLTWRLTPVLQVSVGADVTQVPWIALVAAGSTAVSSCVAAWWGNAASRRSNLSSLLTAS